MQSIGGYFSLELPVEDEYYKNAVRLNTGRNCLEYILLSHRYRKIYIPYYTCEVILEPFHKLGIEYSFYHVDTKLEVADNITLLSDEALLYTNYYGLKQHYVEKLVHKYGSRLIIDNTQAFYAKPFAGVDTFNTCRKFFGVPDGAYLFTDHILNIDIEKDQSFERMTFLTKRIDVSAEAAYSDFREESNGLIGNPIRKMSVLTHRLMCSIDYEKVAEQRRNNYRHLHNALAESNLLKLNMVESAVPMVYPYWVDRGKKLRDKMISHKVFIARYWPNVFDWCQPTDWEYQLTENLVCIPIDQRYGKDEMDFIIDMILHD